MKEKEKVIEKFVEDYYNEVVTKYFIFPEEKTTVYHYTTSKALISILSNNTLRASNIRFMNDTDELEFPLRMFEDAVQIIKHDEDSILNDSIIKYYKEVLIPNISSISDREFVISFSLEKDSLHMWNYYGKNDGYAIGFDLEKIHKDISNKIIKLFNKRGCEYENYSIYNSVVLYDEKIQKEYINMSINKLDILLKSFLANQDVSLNQIFETNIMKITYLIKAALNSMKYEPHKVENEFRYIIIPDKDFEGKSFFDRDGLIVPYITLSFDVQNINDIVIGPKIKDEMAENGLRSIIQNTKNKDIKINHSKIKTR